MIPVQKLLNRIRWDPEFARGTCALGYYDRVENRVILVPFKDVSFAEDDPRALRLVDAEGRIQRVPLHRVREVYKDAQRIWQRFSKESSPEL
jgi:uncharacterized protein (UPF0248 family)